MSEVRAGLCNHVGLTIALPVIVANPRECFTESKPLLGESRCRAKSQKSRCEREKGARLVVAGLHVWLLPAALVGVPVIAGGIVALGQGIVGGIFGLSAHLREGNAAVLSDRRSTWSGMTLR